MSLEQKILLASIREMRELLEIAAVTHQTILVEANIDTLRDRVKRYGDNNTGTGDSGTKPHTN